MTMRGVSTVSYSSGLEYILADFSRFLILISSSSSAQMLTCKYLNFKKSQAEILNYEIINMCRVLYINLNL